MTVLLLQRLGTDLRALRQRRGLTQAALAAQAGLTRAKVLQVEKGLASVSAGAYAAVAQALGAQFLLEPYRRPTLEETRSLFAND